MVPSNFITPTAPEDTSLSGADVLYLLKLVENDIPVSHSGEGTFERRHREAWEDRFKVIKRALMDYVQAKPAVWSLVFNDKHGVNAPTTFSSKESAQIYADRCDTCIPRVVPLYTSPVHSLTAEEIARVIDPEAFCDPAIVGPIPGLYHRREVARNQADKILMGGKADG